MESSLNVSLQYFMLFLIILVPILYLLIAVYVVPKIQNTRTKTLLILGAIVAAFGSLSSFLVPKFFSYLLPIEDLAFFLSFNNVFTAVGKLLFMLGILLLFQEIFQHKKRADQRPTLP